MKKLLLTLACLLAFTASWAVTYSFSLSKNTDWNGLSDYEHEDVTWSITATQSNGTNASSTNFDTSKGKQIGTKNAPATNVAISTSDIPGTITAITVETSGASGTTAKVSVNVNGTDFKCGGETTKALGTTANTSYTFEGSASGTITISWTNTAAAIYLKSVTVEYTVGQTVAKPAFSLEDGRYPIGTELEITCATPGASILYSLDGTEPTTPYTGAITLDTPGNYTVKAVAKAEGYSDSQNAINIVVFDPSVTEMDCTVNFVGSSISYSVSEPNCNWTSTNDMVFATKAEKGSGNSMPAVYSNGLRLYAGDHANIITISAPEGYYFEKAVINSAKSSTGTGSNPASINVVEGNTTTNVKFTDNVASYTFGNPTNAFAINVIGLTNSALNNITFTINTYASGVVIYDGHTYGNAVEVSDCKSIEYIREFASTNWQPWYAPFAVAADEFEQVVELTGADAANNTLEFTTVASTETLDGNKPYMVKPKAAETALISAANGTLLAAASESVEFNGYSITGTYDEKTDMATSGAYAIAADGNFHPAKSDAVVLKPFRVYLNVPTAKAGMPVRMVIDDEEVTGIEGIYVEDAVDGAIYDLQGRRVNNPQGGIFIVNGKKAFINK